MFHSIDEPQPLRTIGLYMVVKVDHFGWEMIQKSYSWVGWRFLCGMEKYYQGPMMGVKCFLLKNIKKLTSSMQVMENLKWTVNYL